MFQPDRRQALIRLAGAAAERAPERAAPHGGMLSFFLLGVEHILLGWDHLLFLVALALRGGRLLSLLAIVTAFTVAHSMTLALAVLGVATLPSRLVEALIAALPRLVTTSAPFDPVVFQWAPNRARSA